MRYQLSIDEISVIKSKVKLHFVLLSTPLLVAAVMVRSLSEARENDNGFSLVLMPTVSFS